MSHVLLKRNLLNILKLLKHSIFTCENFGSKKVIKTNNSILNKYQYSSKNNRLLDLYFGLKNDRFLLKSIYFR